MSSRKWEGSVSEASRGGHDEIMWERWVRSMWPSPLGHGRVCISSKKQCEIVAGLKIKK